MKVMTVNFKSSTFGDDFVKSLKETGFAVIENHPVETDLIKEVYGDWIKYFDSPNKFQDIFNPNSQSGYFPFRSENAKDSSKKDLKEFYHFFKHYNLPQGMPSSTKRLFDNLEAVAQELLNYIEAALPNEIWTKLPMTLSSMIKNSEGTLLRPLHYPPLKSNVLEGEVRASEHCDINLITILVAATASGLQVKDKAGSWHDVESNAGNLVVNIGDMAELVTRGYFKSTPHRVINPWNSNTSRYSLPFFVHPRAEVSLSPDKTAGEFLRERLIEIGLIK